MHTGTLKMLHKHELTFQFIHFKRTLVHIAFSRLACMEVSHLSERYGQLAKYMTRGALYFHMLKLLLEKI